MESVEKMRNIFNILSPKDIMGIGDEVQNRRDVLKKNKDIWYEAWRNNNWYHFDNFSYATYF